MERRIMIERIYPQSLRRVWGALTDRASLARWLGPNDFRPIAGHRFDLVVSERGRLETVACAVVEVIEPHRLSYTWRRPSDGRPSLVTWTLDLVPEGTRLRLEQSVLAEIGVEDPAASDDGGTTSHAWAMRLDALRRAIASDRRRSNRCERRPAMLIGRGGASIHRAR